MTYFLSVFRIWFVRALCDFSVLLFEIIILFLSASLLCCFVVVYFCVFFGCLLPFSILSCPAFLLPVRIFIAPVVFGEKLEQLQAGMHDE